MLKFFILAFSLLLIGCSPFSSKIEKEIIYKESVHAKPKVDMSKFSDIDKVPIKVTVREFTVVFSKDEYLKAKKANTKNALHRSQCVDFLRTNIKNGLIDELK